MEHNQEKLKTDQKKNVWTEVLRSLGFLFTEADTDFLQKSSKKKRGSPLRKTSEKRERIFGSVLV